MWNNLQFVHPQFFVLLLLIPLAGAWLRYNHRQRQVTLKLSNLKSLEQSTSWREKLLFLPTLFRTLAAILLIIALARPQSMLKEEEINADGVDIMLVMDLSSSMLAQDFNPDRLEVSKRVAAEFVEKRPYDRIGLTAFAGEAYTQCPLTTDHKVVQEFLASLECGILEDGTAIGMGLASSVNRLIESEVKSKIVILLTDGVNNAGYIKPITAAEIAKQFGIKVYTIGVGTMGSAYAPVGRLPGGRYRFGLVEVQIDEELMRQIADMTGGKYYRATTVESLQRIYDEIDQLEKTKIQVTTIRRYSEEFHRFAFWGFIFLLLEILLRYTVLRTIP